MSKKQTCNSCGYTGVDLVRIFDFSRQKSMCQHCVDREEVSADAIKMVHKLAHHQAEGTLKRYSMRQRLADHNGKIIH